MTGDVSNELGAKTPDSPGPEVVANARGGSVSRIWGLAVTTLSRLFCLKASMSAHRSAAQVALCFAAFSAVWIFGSDYLLQVLVSDPQQAAAIQTVKGIAFVLATSGVIFLLVRQQMGEALRANATLRESVERLSFVGEHANVGYWHWDIPANSFEWSPVGLRLLGIPAEGEMSLERFYAALHPDDRANVESALGACLTSVSSPDYHFEFRAVWPDGSIHWIEAIGGTTFEGNV